MLRDLLSVFRPARVYRNLFMILGAILALGVTDNNLLESFPTIIVSFISLSLMTSGNYGINEILDLETDRAHPQKKNRSLAAGRISISIVLALSISMYVLSFVVILSLQKIWLTIALLSMFLSGILYNVRPFRVKDYPYMDFLFEALNNPIRLAVGWYSVVNTHEIPSSFIFAFYAIGVFLMASKRFGELRLFNESELNAAEYRASLSYYSEKSLLFSMIASISTFSFMFGVLAFKYNSNLVIMLPFFIVWIVWFFDIAYENNSVVKDPERIFEKKGFLAYSFSLALMFIFLLFSNIELIKFLMQPIGGV